MKIPFLHALTWIVGSLLLIPGAAFKGYKVFLHYQTHTSPPHYLCRIVQTGPQKEALKTAYLAELMQISADRPQTIDRFNSLQAETKLRESPVIKQAVVKVIDPETVYVDYTVRQPIAWLYDFENTALDEEAVPFPITPFFSPKKLPEIYLGVSNFSWSHSLKGPKTDLALTLLKLMQAQALHIQRIDVTEAFAPSLGRREIIVILEEDGFSKFLRLTPKNFAQELGNYLQLRRTLPPKPQVIDLRIPQLAFIG